MPGPAGKPPGDVGGILGIVEDQQPPAALVQVGQHRRPHLPGARPGLDAPQRHPEGGELVPDQPGLLGVDPPRHLIAAGEPVRVLNRQLGLAHPAHTLQRLHHRPVPGQQPAPHRRQQVVPAGEPRIAGRDVPYPQHTARRSRPGPRRAAASSRSDRSTSLPSWSGLANGCVTSPLACTRRRNATCCAPDA